MEENNKENLKDIYLSYTNQASDWTNKRLTLNSIYITLCTTLAGFTVSHFKILGLALSFVGILLSIIWFLTILTFKRMNSAKFQVIKDLENKLGFKPYEMEWKFAKAKKYIKLTTLEKITSIVFGTCFVVLFIVCIITINNPDFYKTIMNIAETKPDTFVY